MIKIEHGCISIGPNQWKYITVTSPSGRTEDVKFTEYPFVSVGDDLPVIGDFIQSGVLVKKTAPQVNSDWSKWKDKDLYGNP